MVEIGGQAKLKKCSEFLTPVAKEIIMQPTGGIDCVFFRIPITWFLLSDMHSNPFLELFWDQESKFQISNFFPPVLGEMCFPSIQYSST